MCVIIVKPANVEMPSEEVLTAAYFTNPDGCGFATPTKFFKSLSYRAFMRQLAKVDAAEPCIIHFRLATHGSVKRQNCHPFSRGGVYFAHNGILGVKPKGDMTDSETAFVRYIYPAIERYGIDSPMVDLAVKEVIGYSKFAILAGSRLRLFGNYVKQPDGCYYSNLNFQSRMLFHNERCHRKGSFMITPCGWG